MAAVLGLKEAVHSATAPSMVVRQSNPGLYQTWNAEQWRDFDALCRKAMAPSIIDRYATVEALREDLDRLEASQPLQARQPH